MGGVNGGGDSFTSLAAAAAAAVRVKGRREMESGSAGVRAGGFSGGVRVGGGVWGFDGRVKMSIRPWVRAEERGVFWEGEDGEEEDGEEEDDDVGLLGP